RIDIVRTLIARRKSQVIFFLTVDTGPKALSGFPRRREHIKAWDVVHDDTDARSGDYEAFVVVILVVEIETLATLAEDQRRCNSEGHGPGRIRCIEREAVGGILGRAHGVLGH